MLVIEKNTDATFAEIRAIAHEVWPVAYGSILSREQLEYMLDTMYSEGALQEQAQHKKHQFILAKEADAVLGFASYELNSGNTHKTKIHKIYIRHSAQGKGVGKALVDYVIAQAQENDDVAVFLNVNRFNPALHFYKKLGFSISFEEVIAIGRGYVMDDYVMEKPM